MTKNEKIKAYGAWCAICFFWGTTYLAIRVGVQTLPPALFAGSRFLLAGLILFIYLRVKGIAWPSPAEMIHMAIVGILLLNMANGLVVWAEQWVPSGLTSLLVATLPFWTAGFEAVIPGGAKLTWRKTAGILIGFSGLILLFFPDLRQGFSQTYLKGVLGLLLASGFWAGGSVYSKYHPVKTHPLMAAAMQMLIAGIIFMLAGALLGQYRQFTFQINGILAIVYLVFFGSIVGYSSFIYALAKLPAAKVAMYAYVNPVVAVFFGWLILDEHVDGTVFIATAIILLGVVLVNSSRSLSAPQQVTEQPLKTMEPFKKEEP
jgi:drug/metabolite transporter (DMT)-like permease